jgi:S-formylglutathione hydrolase FrmB
MRCLLLSLLSLFYTVAFAARVDSIDVPSAIMKQTYKAAVVLPDSYAKGNNPFPVMYLLHGGGGHFRDWLQQTPDKQLVHRLADQYGMIIVMPEGETFGWYMDSPHDAASRFETYITKEVIAKIDATYRTVRNNKGRVITGLSMGGHGALYLATRNPQLFCAAGSMSGAVDMNWSNWRINPDFAKNVQERFFKLLGTNDPFNEVYFKNSVVNMAETIKKNGLPLIIDCGVDDFLLEPNRELHQRLVYNKTPHDYTERPGGHTWDYWGNSLPYHVLFFSKVLKGNGLL